MILVLAGALALTPVVVKAGSASNAGSITDNNGFSHSYVLTWSFSQVSIMEYDNDTSGYKLFFDIPVVGELDCNPKYNSGFVRLTFDFSINAGVEYQSSYDPNIIYNDNCYIYSEWRQSQLICYCFYNNISNIMPFVDGTFRLSCRSANSSNITPTVTCNLSSYSFNSNFRSSTTPIENSSLGQTILYALNNWDSPDDILDVLNDIYTRNTALYNQLIVQIANDTTYYSNIISAINSEKSQLHSDLQALLTYIQNRDGTISSSAAPVVESAADQIADIDRDVDQAQKDIIEDIDVADGAIETLADSANTAFAAQTQAISFWLLCLSTFKEYAAVFYTVIVVGLILGMIAFFLRRNG